MATCMALMAKKTAICADDRGFMRMRAQKLKMLKMPEALPTVGTAKTTAKTLETMPTRLRIVAMRLSLARMMMMMMILELGLGVAQIAYQAIIQGIPWVDRRKTIV